MTRITLTAALLASGLTAAAPAFAETSPMVGGAPMMASKTIVENASKASNLTTLVAAVKEAGLVDTLNG
ncbi:fasciclin domain-containing protein, partial [Methylobacterium hispanicum]